MSSSELIYLDHNATTPVDPRVLEIMLPYFTQVYGNAASTDHDFGHTAKVAVDKAREQIAKAINAFPDEIIFTSGATESDNIALFGIAEKYKDKGKHIITCVTEHKAVLDSCYRLEQMGYAVSYIPVDQYGVIDLEALERSITKETILISVMAANNEIGTLSPLFEIGRMTRKHEVLFHTDAAQAVGYIPIDVQKMNIDLLSISGHKIYGPKGVGALYRRRSNPRVNLAPVIYGGGHERGLRSGTLNVPGIVGMGEAIQLAMSDLKKADKKYRTLTGLFYEHLKKQIPDIELNGHPTNRLPHNLNISIPGIESRALIVGLEKVALSTGSACTSAKVEPSYVILALGFGEERAHTAIRLGVGRSTTPAEIETAAETIASAVKNIAALKL
jgi:cysteine desulfurase